MTILPFCFRMSKDSNHIQSEIDTLNGVGMASEVNATNAIQPIHVIVQSA